MGNCKDSKQEDNMDFDVVSRNMESESHVGRSRVPAATEKSRSSSNPFYEIDARDFDQNQALSKYQFHSHYKDQFLGKCSVLEEKATGNLYLSKQLQFSNEDAMKEQLEELQMRQRALTSENVIQLKQVISKTTDGFFGDKYRIIIILDYPFMNFQRELFNRTNKQISFTKEEIMNFINSTIKGYADIERGGFPTDKVRLKNIFIGIKDRDPIIKVAETNLLASNSNYADFIKKGPHHDLNRDIYLSPEQYSSWAANQKDYVPESKSGVFSLGMSIIDLCIMDPSRQAYLFTEKTIDEQEIKHRIQISGKKYGPGVEKILKKMLDFDQNKRYSFRELEEQLPAFAHTQDSRMHLSVIPSQRSNYINNDNSSLKSSSMFKSVVSENAKSRMFASRIKVNRNPEELENVTEHYTNGNKYTGQKKGNMKHGTGRYQFKDGSVYNGQWADNKINGVGQLYFPNGRIEYSGEWRNDEYNGWGTLYCENENWTSYEGEFKNGVREGRGKMFFKDGNIYDGQFRGGKISGRGRKICANGEVVDKYWETVSPSFFSSL